MQYGFGINHLGKGKGCTPAPANYPVGKVGHLCHWSKQKIALKPYLSDLHDISYGITIYK
jgi:hypothetical protein